MKFIEWIVDLFVKKPEYTQVGNTSKVRSEGSTVQWTKYYDKAFLKRLNDTVVYATVFGEMHLDHGNAQP